MDQPRAAIDAVLAGAGLAAELHLGIQPLLGCSSGLFYIGDTAHHWVISVQRPDWPIEFDEDRATAAASRRAALRWAADENVRVYAVHFPFPGLGRVRKQGDAFVWVPE